MINRIVPICAALVLCALAVALLWPDRNIYWSTETRRVADKRQPSETVRSALRLPPGVPGSIRILKCKREDDAVALAFSPGGKSLVIGSFWSAAVVKVGDGKVINKFKLGSRRRSISLNRVALSPNGHTLAVGLNNGAVDLWDLGNLRKGPRQIDRGIVHSGFGHITFSDVEAITFYDWGRKLCAGFTFSAAAWQVKSGKLLYRIVIPGSSLETTASAVAVSPDNRLLFIGTEQGRAYLRRLPSLHLIKAWRADCGIVSARFSPSGKLLAYGGVTQHLVVVHGVGYAGGPFDPGISVVSVPACANVATAAGDGTGVAALAFTPGSRSLVFCSDGDSTAGHTVKSHVFVWNVANHKRTAALNTGDYAASLAISPDGRLAAIGSAGKVFLWRLKR